MSRADLLKPYLVTLFVVVDPRFRASLPGRSPDAPLVRLSGERQAHVSGFDLDRNVAVPAGDRTRLAHLARYVLRPPVAQDALELNRWRLRPSHPQHAPANLYRHNESANRRMTNLVEQQFQRQQWR